MSTEGPRPYPVVYDPIAGLQYSFPSGYISIPIASAPSSISKIRYATLPTVQTTTSTIFVNSTLGQTIAVGATTNKVRIRMVGNCLVSDQENCYVTIYKDGINLGHATLGMIEVAARGGLEVNAISLEYYDIPADTNAHLYEIWFVSSTGLPVSLKAQNTDSFTLTLEEVTLG